MKSAKILKPNNKMGKIRDLFKKIGEIKQKFHSGMAG